MFSLVRLHWSQDGYGEPRMAAFPPFSQDITNSWFYGHSGSPWQPYYKTDPSYCGSPLQFLDSSWPPWVPQGNHCSHSRITTATQDSPWSTSAHCGNLGAPWPILVHQSNSVPFLAAQHSLCSQNHLWPWVLWHHGQSLAYHIHPMWFNYCGLTMATLGYSQRLL